MMTRHALVLAFVFLALITPRAQAAPIHLPGVPLELWIKSDQKPVLGISYAYDLGDIIWNLTFKSTITAGDLSPLPATLYWNAVDLETGALFQAWTALPKNQIVLGQARLTDQAAKAFLPRQKSAAIVFATSPAIDSTLYYFDVGTLCATYPSHVKNHTQNDRPACEVAAQDIP